LGLVKQERLISEHIGRLNAIWVFGLGAAFDYHSGGVPWEPAALRWFGLE